MAALAAILAVLAASTVLYVLFGYPLLLAWLSRRSRPVRKQFSPRTVSVLLPVKNGERWIEAKLRTLEQLTYPAGLIEILVIDDGSTDGTAAHVLAWPDSRVRMLQVPPGGKSRALNAGLAQATGEILFLTDVRQELDPDALTRLVESFADPEVGVVSGELIILDGETRQEAAVGAYWKYEKWIRQRLGNLDSVLGATGAIYAMRRTLARPLPPDTLLDDVYLPLAAFFAGYRVLFEPAARAYDQPVALAGEFRRKIRTLAGNYQLIGQYPQLLSPVRNRLWLHFVSHKLGRLLLPWALLVLLLASWFLPSPWRSLLLGSQLAFYGLAVLDSLLPTRSVLGRITSPIRTFVVLMAASACAISIFFVPAGSLWRTSDQKVGKVG